MNELTDEQVWEVILGTFQFWDGYYLLDEDTGWTKEKIIKAVRNSS